MALPIETETLDSIEEPFRSLYEEKEGKYRLQVDGVEDTGALKRAKDHEKAARQEAEKRAKALQEQYKERDQAVEALTRQIEEIQAEKLQKDGNPDELAEYRQSLENSYNEKLTKREKELNTQIETLHASIHNVLVDKEALAMAADLATEGSAMVLQPHIQRRLDVEERNGQYVTVVLDQENRPSAMTLQDLEEEIRNTPAFAPIITGSKARGGGAAPSNSGGSASPSGDLSKMSRADKLKYFEQKRNVR